MALALRKKPPTNLWLCLSPRVCTLGEDAFEHAPAVIKEIHAYLKILFNEREFGLAMDYRRKDVQKLLHESPKRRRIYETMRVSYLCTLPEEEFKRYQRELERKVGVTWNRVTFMERTWDVIRRYGTQSVMKVGLNQPIMREVLGKLMTSVESDVLTE